MLHYFPRPANLHRLSPSHLPRPSPGHSPAPDVCTQGRGTIKSGKMHYAFVQYTAGVVGDASTLSLAEKVEELEVEAVQEIFKTLHWHYRRLRVALEALETDSTGTIACDKWATVLGKELLLDLPWVALKGEPTELLLDLPWVALKGEWALGWLSTT